MLWSNLILTLNSKKINIQPKISLYIYFLIVSFIALATSYSVSNSLSSSVLLAENMQGDYNILRQYLNGYTCRIQKWNIYLYSLFFSDNFYFIQWIINYQDSTTISNSLCIFLGNVRVHLVSSPLVECVSKVIILVQCPCLVISFLELSLFVTLLTAVMEKISSRLASGRSSKSKELSRFVQYTQFNNSKN